jgi:acyl carrier protein
MDAHALHELAETALRKHLTALSPEGAIADGDDLHGMGLDSMRSINLLLELEATFGVVIPDELLAPEHYQTFGALKAMLRRALGGE